MEEYDEGGKKSFQNLETVTPSDMNIFVMKTGQTQPHLMHHVSWKIKPKLSFCTLFNI